MRELVTGHKSYTGTVMVAMLIQAGATIVGLNYIFDTLMFCGAILLLAGAMPRES